MSSNFPPDISKPYWPVNGVTGLGLGADAVGVEPAEAEADADADAVATGVPPAVGDEFVRCDATGVEEPHAATRDAIAATTATSRISVLARLYSCFGRAEPLNLGFLDAFGARAVGIVRARLEEAVPAPTLDQRLAADRARLVQEFRPCLGLAVLADVRAVLAVRVTRARDERTITASALDQLPLPALRALLARGLGCRLRSI